MILAVFGPVRSMAVERKVICGYFATSRKSGERRCSSRFGSRVSTLDASMTASTFDLDGS